MTLFSHAINFSFCLLRIRSPLFDSTHKKVDSWEMSDYWTTTTTTHTQTNWPQEQERRARNCFPPWHLPGTSSQRAASVSTVAVAVAAAATKGATSYELSKLLSFKEEKLRRSLDEEEIVVVLLFSFLFRFPLASFSPCPADVFLGNTSPPKFIFSPFSSSSCVCVCCTTTPTPLCLLYFYKKKKRVILGKPSFHNFIPRTSRIFCQMNVRN